LKDLGEHGRRDYKKEEKNEISIPKLFEVVMVMSRTNKMSF
jgi:hypothetical protein